MSSRHTRFTPLRWVAIIMAAVEVYIHAVLAPSHLQEKLYVGLGFILADVLLTVVLIGLLVGRLRPFGWLLGATVCAGMFAAFLLSRTTGLPGYHETRTSDGGLGLVSLPPEVVFIGCAVASLRVRRAPQRPRTRSRCTTRNASAAARHKPPRTPTPVQSIDSARRERRPRERSTTMTRKTRLAVAACTALAAFAVGVTPASAQVSTTQRLPPAACNAGTMNAHEQVPETTGNGTPISAHDAIPGTANVSPCGHGG